MTRRLCGLVLLMALLLPDAAAPAKSVSRPGPSWRHAVVDAGVQGTGPDQEAVQAVLDSYLDAYRKRDVRAVQRVFPSANARVLEAQFKRATRMDVKMASPKIDFSPDRNRATVLGNLDVDQAAMGQRSLRCTQEIRLSLEKRADVWVIVERRGDSPDCK